MLVASETNYLVVFLKIFLIHQEVILNFLFQLLLLEM